MRLTVNTCDTYELSDKTYLSQHMRHHSKNSRSKKKNTTRRDYIEARKAKRGDFGVE